MNAHSLTWLVEALVASTVLIGAVFVLRWPVARLFGPHAAYLLWAIPGLRLMLPPLPAEQVLPVRPAETAALAPLQALQQFGPSDTAVSGLRQSVSLASDVDWALVLLVVWLIGVAIHAAWHVASYRRFIKSAVGGGGTAHRLDGILVYNADVAGPAAAGVMRRCILVPYDFANRFTPRERRLALAHEVAHHRRGDLVANWAALAVLSLHWFNPLAHIAYRAFRADQELACDATVLRGASQGERHAYASAVVKAAWARSPVAACPLNSAGQVKARLAMMKARGIERSVAGLVVVCVVAVAAVGATASRTAAALPALHSSVERADAPTGSSARSESGLGIEPVVIDAAAAPRDNGEGAIAAGSLDAVSLAAHSARDQNVILEPSRQGAAAEDRQEPAMPGRSEPPRAEQPQPIVLAAAVSIPGLDHRPVEPVATAILAASPLPSAPVLRALAASTREDLSLSSRNVTSVRNTRAVMVDGRFNDVDPGTPFVGFCGEILLYGERSWLRFFVSPTRSKPGRAEKCAGLQSAEDYSVYFKPTEAQRDSISAKWRRGCTADRSTCNPAFQANLSPSFDPNQLALRVIR